MEHHLAKVGVAGSIPVSRSEGGSRIAIRWFGAFLRIYMKPRKNKKLTARKLACRGKAAFLFLCGECRDEIESRSDSMSERGFMYIRVRQAAWLHVYTQAPSGECHSAL